MASGRRSTIVRRNRIQRLRHDGLGVWYAVLVDGEEVRIETSARSFLHNQVRSMVGSLAQVGDAKFSADDLAAALAARSRAACGPVAPPEGLYLMRVDY